MHNAQCVMRNYLGWGKQKKTAISDSLFRCFVETMCIVSTIKSLDYTKP